MFWSRDWMSEARRQVLIRYDDFDQDKMHLLIWWTLLSRTYCCRRRTLSLNSNHTSTRSWCRISVDPQWYFMFTSVLRAMERPDTSTKKNIYSKKLNDYDNDDCVPSPPKALLWTLRRTCSVTKSIWSTLVSYVPISHANISDVCISTPYCRYPIFSIRKQWRKEVIIRCLCCNVSWIHVAVWLSIRLSMELMIPGGRDISVTISVHVSQRRYRFRSNINRW